MCSLPSLFELNDMKEEIINSPFKADYEKEINMIVKSWHEGEINLGEYEKKFCLITEHHNMKVQFYYAN